MKHLVLNVLAFMLLGVGAQAAVLDFETDATGNPVTRLAGPGLPDHTPYLVGDTYLPLGVAFSSDGDTNGAETNPFFGNLAGATGANTIVQDSKREVSSSFNIRADFTDLVKDISMDVYSATGETVTMTAFDMLGTSLGSVTSGSLTYGIGEAISLSGIGGASYVIWESSSPLAALVGIDNLAFNVPAIPLPAGGVLLASGLAGLGWMRRRKAA